MQHSLTRESGIGARRMFVSDDPRRVKTVTFRAAKCHSVRSSGITAYLKVNVATIVRAQAIAAHEKPRNTDLPDRTAEDSHRCATEKVRFEGGASDMPSFAPGVRERLARSRCDKGLHDGLRT